MYQTHAETSFQYLHDRATIAREAILSSANRPRPYQTSNSAPTATLVVPDDNLECDEVLEPECSLQIGKDIPSLTCTFHRPPAIS
jgi:hypothetical protein